MLMSPDMSGVSGGGNTNTNNSQINQSIANTLGLNAAGTNPNVPMVSTDCLLFFGEKNAHPNTGAT